MAAKIDDGLTVQQGRFAALIARGANLNHAYAQAFKCKGMSQKTIDEKACRLEKNSKIKARAHEILREARIEDIDHANVAFNDLLRHIQKAEAAENWTALASLDRLRLQHHGMLKADAPVEADGAERDRKLIAAMTDLDPEVKKVLRRLMGSHEVFPAPPTLVVDNAGKA